MKREELLKQMEKESTKVDCAEIIKLINESNKRNNERGKPDASLVIAMEELAELIQEVSKVIRGKEDTLHLEEELADTMFALFHIILLSHADVDNMHKIMNVKANRLREKLKDTGYCQ